MGSPVHSSASTTGLPSFACPYQTSGSISERSFFIPHQNHCLPHCGPFLMFFLLFHLLLYLLRFLSFSIFLALSPSFPSSFFGRSSWLESLAPYFLLTLSSSAFSSFSFFFRLLRLSFYSVSLLFFFDDSRLLIFFFSIFCLIWLSIRFRAILTFCFPYFICRLRFPMHADLYRDIRRPVAPFTVTRPQYATLFEFDILPDPSCIKHAD